MKMHPDRDATQPLSYCNEDRHINIKLRPLKEGKWWPAVAVGWDDIGSLRIFKVNKGFSASGYFENIYLTASKHFEVKDYQIGIHLAYRYYSMEGNRNRRGVAGGVTLRPAFYRPLRFIVEWDGIGVNVGADVLLWRHLFIQAALIHGQGFTGGLAYHYTIPF